jgi:hypothetical protein
MSTQIIPWDKIKTAGVAPNSQYNSKISDAEKLKQGLTNLNFGPVGDIVVNCNEQLGFASVPLANIQPPPDDSVAVNWAVKFSGQPNTPFSLMDGESVVGLAMSQINSRGWVSFVQEFIANATGTYDYALYEKLPPAKSGLADGVANCWPK